MISWEKAEDIVYKYFSKRKNAYIARLNDTKDINKRIHRFVKNAPSPLVYVKRREADFLVIDSGITFFAEVKCTANVRGVTQALFDEQAGLRDRILRAGGKYAYFVHSTRYGKWYAIPAEVIAEKSSRTWEELSEYETSIFGRTM